MKSRGQRDLGFDSRDESCLALGHHGDVVVKLYAAQVLAARKTAMHPQKNAEGHRSLIGDAVGCGTDLSVIFGAFLWMYSGLLRAARAGSPSRPLERIRARGPWWQVLDCSLGAHRMRTPNGIASPFVPTVSGTTFDAVHGTGSS